MVEIIIGKISGTCSCACTLCLTAGLSSQGHSKLEKWSGLASRIDFVARNKLEPNSYIWTLLSFAYCICNTAYNLKAVFFHSGFPIINFGCPFVVTASTHSNMNLKSGGWVLQPPCASLAYTIASVESHNTIITYNTILCCYELIPSSS